MKNCCKSLEWGSVILYKNKILWYKNWEEFINAIHLNIISDSENIYHIEVERGAEQ